MILSGTIFHLRSTRTTQLKTSYIYIYIRSSLAVVVWRFDFSFSTILMMKTVYFLLLYTHTYVLYVYIISRLSFHGCARSLFVYLSWVYVFHAFIREKHVFMPQLEKSKEENMRGREWQQMITWEKLLTIDHTRLLTFRKTSYLFYYLK